MPSLRDLACLGLSLEKRDDGRETVEELVKRLLWMKSNGVDNAISVIISEQFRRFFMSYAKAVNKQTGRVGSLFQKHFKRLHVESAAYLKQVILYIHANPQLHGLCDDFRDWPDSSYHAFLSERPTKLARTAVLDFFGGKEAFIAAHDHYIDWRMAEKWMIED